jgi:hypothetical protein
MTTCPTSKFSRARMEAYRDWQPVHTEKLRGNTMRTLQRGLCTGGLLASFAIPNPGLK